MMKKPILILLASTLFAGASAAAELPCSSNQMVGRWLRDHEASVREMVDSFISGEPSAALAPHFADILASELKVNTECYKEPDFVRSRLVLMDSAAPVTLETAPALFLNRLTGGMLSPERQYEDLEPRRKGGFK